MDQVLAHLEEYAVAYVLLALCLLPILYVTRRYSIPLIAYTLEIICYLILIHVAIWVAVVVTRWFKEQSTMRVLADGSPERPPDWGTPLLEFWDREQYNPEWLVWLELAAVVIVIGLVWKYRPLRVQHRKGWRYDEKKVNKGFQAPMARGKMPPKRAGRR